MSHQINAKGRANARPAPKPLDAALASAIQELGALIEASPDAAELRRASRVLRSLAYIATLRANARQERKPEAWSRRRSMSDPSNAFTRNSPPR